jgi:hypothetical protein
VRAAVEFHRGGFRSPPTLTLRPMLLPNGIGVAGAF